MKTQPLSPLPQENTANLNASTTGQHSQSQCLYRRTTQPITMFLQQDNTGHRNVPTAGQYSPSQCSYRRTTQLMTMSLPQDNTA
jgi:hypothetical protein